MSSSSFYRDAEDDYSFNEDPMDVEDGSGPAPGWLSSGGAGGRHSEELARYKNQQGLPEKVVHQDFFNDFDDDFDDEDLK